MKKSLIFVILILFCLKFFTFVEKKGTTFLESLTFQKKELRVTEDVEEITFLENVEPLKTEAVKFNEEWGRNFKIWIDKRRGIFSLIDGGAIPLLPGKKTTVDWKEFSLNCNENTCIELEKVEKIARDFIKRYPQIFPFNEEELVLDEIGSGPVGDSLYFLRFNWKPFGILVEDASLSFRFNSGNLIQISSRKIGKIDVSPYPFISEETAFEIFSSYIGGITEKDKIYAFSDLIFVPVVPNGVTIEGYQGKIGDGLTYSLAYRFLLEREGETGRYEILIDAHTGEILRFVDINRYGKVHGVVYPGDNHNNPQDRPFPYVATGLPSPNEYSDYGGRFPGEVATLNLGGGKYVKIVDNCGNTLLSTTNGDADYGMSIGTDCGVPDPNPAGPGNTWSSKVQYYHLTMVNIKARSYFPNNSWLNNQAITVYVNKDPLCNASSGGSYLNFYKSSTGCWNLGEIPGVSLHEWGHSFDVYDGSGGESPPLETRADWTAIIQLRDSCVGRGAFTSGNCSGYGDACLDCSGIRDADYMKHQKKTPWTPANNGSVYNCSSGSYNGPCGWEDHCESGIASQALWDLATRDLPQYCGVDQTTAWQIVDRLFFTSMPLLGYMYNCNGSTKQSDGCGGDTLYTVFRAIDDDGDGTYNGTPHAKAIFKALSRHNIACGNEDDPQNQNYSSCYELNPTVLSAFPSNDSVALSWTPVEHATKYLIFRNEFNCNAGYTKIGSVNYPQNTFLDQTVINGMTYYYIVQPVQDTESCMGSVSNCVTATPSTCSGLVVLDKGVVDCSLQEVKVKVIDGNANSPIYVTAFSSSTPSRVITIQLNETQPQSKVFEGVFYTTPSSPQSNQVQVSDGDVVIVDYIDQDYCGQQNHLLETKLFVDCKAPLISNVAIQNVMADSVEITWETDEPTNSKVYYGETLPPTNLVVDQNMVLKHKIKVENLNPCSIYYFYVSSSDLSGATAIEDNNGNYYSFKTLYRVYSYGPFNVEGGNDIWTPSGTAGSIWHRDTCKSHSPNYSFKAGSTTCPGTYGNSVLTTLQSQPINLGSSPHNYKLRFWEYYSTESGYDFCQVLISNNGGSSWVELSKRSGYSGGWIKREYDLSQFSGSIIIKFQFTSDSSVTDEGWYIDDIEISDDRDCVPEIDLISSNFIDICEGEGSGGNNGYVDAGEDLVITINLKNIGYAKAEDVYAILTSNSSDVTIIDGYDFFGDIDVNEIKSSSQNGYRIRVNPSIQCNANIPLTLKIYSRDGFWEKSFAFITGHFEYPTVTIWSESFDNITFPPSGWKVTDVVNTSGNWARATNTVHPAGGGTHSGTGLAYFNSFTATAGHSTRLHQDSVSTTIPINANNPRVRFFMYHDVEKTQTDRIRVQVSTDGTNWVDPPNNTFFRYDGTTGWREHSVSLNSYKGQTIKIGFLGYSQKGNDCHIDDVVVEYDGTPYCVQNICTPICIQPSEPVITSIMDKDGCLQNGIVISFTSGSPSTRNDLYMDGNLVSSNITSPFEFNPNDSLNHTYFIRTVYITEDCYNDSNVYSFRDEVCSNIEEVSPGGDPSNALLINSLNVITWTPISVAIDGYRLYRGTYQDLPFLLSEEEDFCLRYQGTNSSFDASLDDPSGEVDRVYFYVVTAFKGQVEGSAGKTSSNQERHINSKGVCSN